jgi:hypothetical protein
MMLNFGFGKLHQADIRTVCILSNLGNSTSDNECLRGSRETGQIHDVGRGGTREDELMWELFMMGSHVRISP